MHIPDGYLGLQTSMPAFGAMIPIWSAAAARVKRFAGGRQIPLLSLCAAFSFVIMMFNIPVGPSSVHAVGAVFAAVLLGPWAACISVSVAIVIQALVFGDGGVLTIGANCFNMAFVLVFAGYGVYRLVSGKSHILSKRSLAGIFAGGYIGINAAAFITAIEFGIQPLLFKSASGVPLYGFYPLSVSIPAIMTGHLLVAGPVEGAITVFAAAYIARFSPQLLERAGTFGDNRGLSFFAKYKAFIIGLAVLIAAAPLGLLATGTAWGEWGKGEVKDILGYVPSGLDKLSGIWRALLPDYAVKGMTGGFIGPAMGYVISALVGVLSIVVVVTISSRFMIRRSGGNERENTGKKADVYISGSPVKPYVPENKGEAQTHGNMAAMVEPDRTGVPEWLLVKDRDCGNAGSGRGTDFFGRTAARISGALQDDLLAERFASLDAFMQGVDPRVKLITILLLMVLTGLTPSITALVLLAASAVVLVLLSGLEFGPFVKRVWLVIPLILLVFSIPAASNLLIPGKTVLEVIGRGSFISSLLGRPEGIFFTVEGITAVTRVFLRTGVSISFGYLLVMTTRWSSLTASLRSLKVPGTAVGILNMTYRYIFVLVQVATEMFEARFLRTVGRTGNRADRRFISGRIAILFVKANALSEEIYESMLCRCYNGGTAAMEGFRLTRNDFAWMCDFVLILVLVLLFSL